MKLENSFDVPVAPAEAWRVLTDVKRVAPCVPGAALTEAVDDNTYKGTMKVKLGPVSLSFDGEATFLERNEATYTARLTATGREARNRGSANAEVVFVLDQEGTGTRVAITTDLQLAGSVAQYGRGQGVIAAVSQEMTEQFAQCLRRDILGVEPGVEPGGAAGGRAAGAPASGLGILWGALMRAIRRLFGRG